MDLEDNIFKTYILNESKLISYGFVKDKDNYLYFKRIMDGNFEVKIIIDAFKKISGKIYDLESEDEYTNFRVKNVTGKFALSVRDEYLNILKDIRDKCFEKRYFILNQSNRITNYIIKKYGVLPEFLWAKNPGFGVFRNRRSLKWFGIIMNIDMGKILLSKSLMTEVINIKVLDTDKFIKKEGIYPAYHMNKKNWVKIILNDTLEDNEIINLIDMSYEFSNFKK